MQTITVTVSRHSFTGGEIVTPVTLPAPPFDLDIDPHREQSRPSERRCALASLDLSAPMPRNSLARVAMVKRWIRGEAA